VKTTRRFGPAVIVAAALVLVSSEKGQRTASAASRPMTLTITIDGTQFKPDNATIRVGDRIVWVNKDPFPHTATSKPSFDSGSIESGASWTYVASAPGEYQYVCRFHPTMKGIIRVK
jgi:plastocyanin